MNDLRKVLFSLLRFELCGEEISAEVKALITTEILMELYDLSNHHDIAHLISNALKRNELLPENEVISQKFEESQYIAVYRYVNLNHELNRVCAAFEEAQIPFIPLKGAVIRDFYPEPYLRTSCDVDILVKPSDVDRAVEALQEKLNYEYTKGYTEHDQQLFSPSGIHIELHYALIEDNRMPKACALLNNVWLQAQNKTEYNLEMTSELFILYHIVHMVKHFLEGGCGIRTFIDLWLVQNNMAYDIDKLKEYLRQSSLLDFYETAVTLANAWFANGEYSDISKEVEEFVLTGGIYGTNTNANILAAARGEGFLKVLFNIIFLSKRNLGLIYPNVQKYPILMPYYQILRWFRVIDRNKRERVLKITESRNAVSKWREESAKALLSNLQLDKL